MDAAQPVAEEDALLEEEPSPLGFNENIAREREKEREIEKRNELVNGVCVMVMIL